MHRVPGALDAAQGRCQGSGYPAPPRRVGRRPGLLAMLAYPALPRHMCMTHTQRVHEKPIMYKTIVKPSLVTKRLRSQASWVVVQKRYRLLQAKKPHEALRPTESLALTRKRKLSSASESSNLAPPSYNNSEQSYDHAGRFVIKQRSALRTTHSTT